MPGYEAPVAGTGPPMLRLPVSTRATRPVVSALAVTLGGTFYVVGKLRRRRRKPLHPDGAVLPGTLQRDGAPTAWGAPWLDATGEHPAVVRLSRSAGLPQPLPDVLGLAVQVCLDGQNADLLMSSAGPGRVGRFLLRPRFSHGRGIYTTLLPYRSPRGPVFLAAEPQPPRQLPTDLIAMATQLSAEPMRFVLSCAAPGGAWERFGSLEVGSPTLPAPRSDGSVDAQIAFDPVLHPLPGLQLPDWLARIRATTYAAARRARGLPD